MPNTENIRKWTAGLRSDRYEQGKYALHRGGKHCSNGVACEEAIADGVELEQTIHWPLIGAVRDTEIWYDGESALLPPKVRDWLGFDNRDPLVKYKDEWHKISALNDDGAFNFADIADAIDRTYLGDESDAWWSSEALPAHT